MDIKTPTLLIDLEKCRGNIDAMLKKAQQSSAQLRPHFKTHFSAQIGQLYKDIGVEACTVSSVSMANYFAAHGWNDITIAFPYNPRELDDISSLAGRVKLNILIESEESLTHAKQYLKNSVGYFVKIDVGTNRTGIDPRNEYLIKSLVGQSTDQVQYKGLLAHAGHTYGCKDFDSVKWIFDGAVKVLTDLRSKFGGIISYGDTPSCSLMDDLSFCDELRPGNFIFYDWMQHEIGSCSVEEIAVCLACPVVAIHPSRNEVVVYGGAVHLSKDSLGEMKTKSFGKAVKLEEKGWSTKVIGNVSRVSQEHGIIKLNDGELAHVKVGDVIGVIPVHSCLTADLQGYYLSTMGERIEKMTKN